MRFIYCIVFLVATQTVFALDSSDSGVYQIFGKDDKPIEKQFRFTVTENSWRLEDKNEDGTFTDVSCTEGCTLSVTTQKDLRLFFSEENLNQVDVDCVNNKAFAFCRMALKGDQSRSMHTFAMNLNNHWVMVRVARIN